MIPKPGAAPFSVFNGGALDHGWGEPAVGVIVSIDKETWKEPVYEVLIAGEVEAYTGSMLIDYVQLKAYEKRISSRA